MKKETIIEMVKRVIREELDEKKVFDMAVDFLDYAGGQVQGQNWKQNKRYINYFNEEGIDDALANKIYKIAVRLSNEK